MFSVIWGLILVVVGMVPIVHITPMIVVEGPPDVLVVSESVEQVLTVPEMIRRRFGDLANEALSVAWQESRYSEDAIGDHGNSLGVFQLNRWTWAPYCGLNQSELLEAAKNIQCAWEVYWYDIGHGYIAWNQWSVKPRP